MIHHVPSLFVAKNNKGRGIFTTEKINKGDLIEVCPLIIIPKDQVKQIHESKLHDYYFLWGEDQKEIAIALGYGSLYNHQLHPNADFLLDLVNETIDIFCIKDIGAGEEITINYHGEDGANDPLWFEEE
ncbi:MAG: SET domain-containing protein [Bacteroidota bacterium]